jgi:hypothetical protein
MSCGGRFFGGPLLRRMKKKLGGLVGVWLCVGREDTHHHGNNKKINGLKNIGFLDTIFRPCHHLLVVFFRWAGIFIAGRSVLFQILAAAAIFLYDLLTTFPQRYLINQLFSTTVWRCQECGGGVVLNIAEIKQEKDWSCASLVASAFFLVWL